MTRAEKAERILKILDEYQPEIPVPLRHDDAFTLLIAVLLSAQCTDARVNLVTPALFARANTPEQMAKLTVPQILGFIKSCGLAPSKAKNIAALSRILVDEYVGRVPDSFEALEALPGVGHKTASVVMVQAFGRPAFPVDTHIHRLAARWGLSRGTRVEQTEADLKRLFPAESWGRIHLQMIYFGREQCPARGHDLAGCPICSWAASKARIQQEKAPTSKRRSAKRPSAKRPSAKRPSAKRPSARRRSAASSRRRGRQPAP
jgi:endonuclease-3